MERVTIIASVVNSDSVAGGIQSWVREYSFFSRRRCRVLGVSRPKVETAAETRHLEDFVSIAEFSRFRRVFPETIRLMWGILKNRNELSQLILLHHFELTPLVRFMKPDSRIVLVIHTNLHANTRRGSDSLWRYVQFLHPLWERLALRSADAVVSHSSADISRLRGLRADIFFLPNWFDDTVFRFRQATQEAELVLWVGRFEIVKDPTLAVRAIAQLKTTRQVEMVMLGSGSQLVEIEALISELGLAEVVTVRNPVAPEELATWFARATMLLHTSHFEGSSKVIKEALAVGTPVVAVSAADPEGLVISSGRGAVVMDRYPSEIASAIEKTLQESRSEEPLIPDTYAATRVIGRIDQILEGL